MSPGRVGRGQAISPPAPIIPPAIVRSSIDEEPHGDSLPCASRLPPNRRASSFGKHRVEMKRLRVEAARELDDFRFAEPVSAADEPLPDAQIIEVKRVADGRRSGHGHRFLGIDLRSSGS